MIRYSLHNREEFQRVLDASQALPKEVEVCGMEIDLDELGRQAFEGASFSQVIFTGTNYDALLFVGCQFTRCRFDGASMAATLFDGCRFVQSSFTGTTLSQSFMRECEFVTCDLRTARLIGLSMVSVNLQDTALDYAVIDQCQLYQVTLPNSMPFSKWNSSVLAHRYKPSKEADTDLLQMTNCQQYQLAMVDSSEETETDEPQQSSATEEVKVVKEAPPVSGRFGFIPMPESIEKDKTGEANS